MLVHQARGASAKRDTDVWLEQEGGAGLALALAGCRKFWAQDEEPAGVAADNARRLPAQHQHQHQHQHQQQQQVEEIKDADRLAPERYLIVVPPKWREFIVLVLGETSLPRLDFRCQVSLTSCPRLERMHSGFTVTGDLMIEQCDALVELPPDLAVYGSLTISRCANLRRLGPGTYVEGDCRIQGCRSFAGLPSDLRVGGDLELNMLDDIETLPAGLAVAGRVILSFGPTLAMLTDDEILARAVPREEAAADMARRLETPRQRRAVVGGSLRAMGCKRVELGENTWIGGTLCVAAEGGPAGLLDASNFPSPRVLPYASLFVGGNLHLEGLAGAAELPAALRVRGESLNLVACWGVTHLPSSLFDARSAASPLTIRLTGTSVRGGALDAVSTMQVPHVSVDISGSHFVEPAPAQRDSKVLADEELAVSVRAWHPTLDLEVDPAYQRGVLLFLAKLRSSKEYSVEALRPGLVDRVREALELLASADASTRAELVSRICDSVDSCGDKPIWALNQMCALAAIIRARGDADALREVGGAIMRLGIVHDHARRKLQALGPLTDDVCVFLRYEIGLRDRLALPVSAIEMLYPSYVEVQPSDLEAAARAVEAISEHTFQRWLSAWDEWRRYLRTQEVVPYAALRAADDVSRLMGSWDRAVLLRNEVCDYDEIVDYWVRTGLDLLSNARVEARALFSALARGPELEESDVLAPLADEAASNENSTPLRQRTATAGGQRRRDKILQAWTSFCNAFPTRNKSL